MRLPFTRSDRKFLAANFRLEVVNDHYDVRRYWIRADVVQPFTDVQRVANLILKYGQRTPWVLSALNSFTKEEIDATTHIWVATRLIAASQVHRLEIMNQEILTVMMQIHRREFNVRALRYVLSDLHQLPNLSDSMARSVIMDALVMGAGDTAHRLAHHYHQDVATLTIEATEQAVVHGQSLRYLTKFRFKRRHLRLSLLTTARENDRIILDALRARYDTDTLLRYYLAHAVNLPQTDREAAFEYIVSTDAQRVFLNPAAPREQLQDWIRLWKDTFHSFPASISDMWNRTYAVHSLPMVLEWGYRIPTSVLWHRVGLYIADYDYGAVNWLATHHLMLMADIDISLYLKPDHKCFAKFQSLWPTGLSGQLAKVLEGRCDRYSNKHATISELSASDRDVLAAVYAVIQQYDSWYGKQ